MTNLIFEWDEQKNKINKEKHKISFEEAETAFYDEYAIVIDDPDHSQEEDRFIILGLSTKANLLVVCHCYRASDTVIRIISARKANLHYIPAKTNIDTIESKLNFSLGVKSI